MNQSHVVKSAVQLSQPVKSAGHSKIMPEFFPLDEGIEKRVSKDGKVVYMHPAEGRVSHTTLTPYDILNLHFGALRSLLEFMDDETSEKFGFLLETVIQNAENHVDKVFELIEEDAGIKNIEVHIVRKGSHFWRPGRVAGVTITRESLKGDNNGQP